MLLLFGLDASMIVPFLLSILKWLMKPAWSNSVIITTILGGAFQAIQNPEGMINTFLNKGIDITVGNLPSTPTEYKIGSIVTHIVNDMPFGGGYFVDIIQGIVGMFGLYIAVKAVKLMPFT